MVPEKFSGYKKTQFCVFAPKNMIDDLCFSLNEGRKVYYLFIHKYQLSRTTGQQAHSMLWESIDNMTLYPFPGGIIINKIVLSNHLCPNFGIIPEVSSFFRSIHQLFQISVSTELLHPYVCWTDKVFPSQKHPDSHIIMHAPSLP